MICAVTDVVSPEDREFGPENERLRRKSRMLREERAILKRDHSGLRQSNVVKFRVVEDYRVSLTTDRLCRVMNVSPRGLRAFRGRPASYRPLTDMFALVQIKEQSRLSYGRPQMTEELKEVGVDAGQRRGGRPMPENGSIVERTYKFRVEEGRQMIRGIICPMRHRQRSQVRHRDELAGL